MHFYGVTLKNEELAFLFDALRFVVQPDALRRSHVTVRGPYKNKIDVKKFANKKLGDLGIIRPANFLYFKQNTVFLECEIVGIRDVWHKPDYQDGVIHITIYDGDNSIHAVKIYNELSKYSWDIWTPTTELHLLEKKIINTEALNLLAPDFVRNFNHYYSSQLEINNVRRMSFDKRFRMFVSLLDFINKKYILRLPTQVLNSQ